MATLFCSKCRRTFQAQPFRSSSVYRITCQDCAKKRRGIKRHKFSLELMFASAIRRKAG